MGDGRFRREPCLDQPSGSWGLDDAVGAGPARIFGTARDDDAELRLDHVETLGDILAMQCRHPPQAQMRLPAR